MIFFFFFSSRRRHTRFDCDWSSDVCSSDLGSQTPDVEPFAEAFRSMWEHLVTIHRETGHTLEHINLGGGIPVNYLRDRSQADQLPKHERDMLGAELEPAKVLSEALRVARESARIAQA